MGPLIIVVVRGLRLAPLNTGRISGSYWLGLLTRLCAVSSQLGSVLEFQERLKRRVVCISDSGSQLLLVFGELILGALAASSSVSK